MKILAVDTATEAFSVALCIDDEIHQTFALAPREHAARLLPTVDQVLAEGGLRLADLDLLAVTRGPGSFTGVRIGIAAVQGLALGSGLPVAPVSTLQTLALGCARRGAKGSVLALLDARMDQVYTAGYRFDDPPMCGAAVDEERVVDPEKLTLAAGDWTLAGAGVAAYQERTLNALQEQPGVRVAALDPDAYPEARDAATIAAASSLALKPEEIEPAYLRAAVQR